MDPTIHVQFLETEEGKVPFEEWYSSLKDKVTRVRIRRRLDRLQLGNFGDAESVGEGVHELRLHFGAGYRIYFARIDNLVVLLGGGDKSTQRTDITRAKSLWRRYANEVERYAGDLGA